MRKIDKQIKAIEILKTYSGNDPYIKWMANSFFMKKMTLTDEHIEYVLANHLNEIKPVNKVVKVAKWWVDKIYTSWDVTFIPERLYIMDYFGETPGAVYVSYMYKQGMPNPVRGFIPKRALLDDLFVEDFRKMEVDFTPYDQKLAAKGWSVLDHQKEAVKFLLTRKKCILADEPGLGKAQPLTSKVLTPSGWKCMGDIVKGDIVCGTAGGPQKVLNVYPQGMKPVYRLKFNDGAVVEASDEHLWLCNVSNAGFLVHTTRDLVEIMEESNAKDGCIKGKPLIKIPTLSNYVRFDSKKCDIDGKKFGRLVGYGIISPSKKKFAYRLNKEDKAILKKWNVFDKINTDERFIPDIIKYNDYEIRVDCLKGIYQCDGTTLDDGTTVIYTISETMMKDIQDIVGSLGGSTEIVKQEVHINQTLHNPVEKDIQVYSIQIKMPDWAQWSFTNPGLKKDVLKELNINLGIKKSQFVSKYVTSIEYIGEKECQCIKVSNPDHLYVTDGYTITHNTVSCIISSLEGKFKKVLIICPVPAKKDWERDLKLFVDESEIGFIKGGNWEEGKKYYLVNYENIEKFHRAPAGRKKEDYAAAVENSILLKENFDLIIIDEVHRLSDAKTLHAKTILSYLKMSGIENVFTISGTPMPNGPVDLFNVLAIIGHELSQNYNYYVTQYCAGKKITNRHTGGSIIIPKGTSNLDELYEKIKNIYLRREKSTLGDAKVKMDIIKETYELPENDRFEYETIWMKHVAKCIAQGIDPDSLNKQLTEPLHQRIFLSVKMVPFTIRKAEEHLAKGEKVFIACSFNDEIYMLKDYFGEKAVVYNGEVTEKQKEAAKKKFQEDPETRVFLGNIAACGVSLTLTAGNICIFNSYDWVPGNNEQAWNRVNRIGQMKDVIVYFQIFKDTIYDRMFDVIVGKQIGISQVIKKDG